MKVKSFLAACAICIIAVLSSGFINSPTIHSHTEDDGKSFTEFLSHFEKVEMPYSINLEDLKAIDKNDKSQAKVKNKISKLSIKGKQSASPIAKAKYIPETARGMFSRMGPPQIEAVARFYPTDKSIAVIYTAHRSYDNTRKNYRLVVYDMKGNIVFPKIKKDRKILYSGFEIAHSSLRNTTTCKIDKEGNIWQNTYDNEWKEDLKKKGYLENELVSYTLTDTQVFKFNDNGVAVQLKELPVDDRASL